jgi:2-(1,2-epoxy-1,2-dihydrophenyl)acetyl-CoA isomerase
MSSTISNERRGRVRWVTLDNPGKGNALDRDAMVALTAAIREAGEDEETRVVVIRGAGDAFSTGADLRAARGTLPSKDSPPRERKTEDAPEPEFVTAVKTIWNLPKPVFAAVGGIAAGFGCSLALACDVRIAAARARFSLVFVKRGLALDGGASFFLPKLAGLNGLEFALSGDVVAAERALALGLVNRVVPDAEFDAHVAESAERMAENAPLALAEIKRAVHLALSAPLEDVLTEEVRTVRRLVRTEDVKEGVASFLEKRKPVFRGR